MFSLPHDWVVTCQLGVGFGIVFIVLRFLEKSVFPLLKSRRAADNQESMAGGKSVEFWDLRFYDIFRKVVKELIVPMFEQQNKIIERVSETQSEIAATQHKLANLMEKVITLQEIIQSNQSVILQRAAGAGQ